MRSRIKNFIERRLFRLRATQPLHRNLIIFGQVAITRGAPPLLGTLLLALLTTTHVFTPLMVTVLQDGHFLVTAIPAIKILLGELTLYM